MSLAQRVFIRFRMHTCLRVIVLSTTLLTASACGSSMPPDVAITELRNPEANVRRNAADSLRTDAGVPPNAVRPLLEALATEQDPPVRGAILITLGKSAAPEAKPVIDQAVQQASDPNMRRWAARALKYWMLETKQLPQNYEFPDGWPYGTPGYPPK
jgi:hypothetical protein